MIALGENATQFKDCEKVTILVSTNQWKHLEGTIELEVGREYFIIRVEELSSSVQYGKPDLESIASLPKEVPKASSSDASSKSNRSLSPVSKGDGKGPRVAEDINYACMGQLFEDDATSFENTEERFFGEKEILGCKPIDEMPPVIDHVINSNGNCNGLCQGQGKGFEQVLENTGPTWASIAANGLDKGENMINDNVLDDLNSLGYNKLDLAHLQSHEINNDLDLSGDQLEARPTGFVSWAESVDKLNNSKVDIANEGIIDDVLFPRRDSEEDEVGSGNFFPELKDLQRKRKGKRYGSISSIQDKFLSENEKRKRDRTLKIEKKKKKKKKNDFNKEVYGIEDRSLSDVDLLTRQDILAREARKTLQLGNSFGMEYMVMKRKFCVAIVTVEIKFGAEVVVGWEIVVVIFVSQLLRISDGFCCFIGVFVLSREISCPALEAMKVENCRKLK
ncbi:hypothetical protein GQ457_02G033890 [Hibiscus cannabinus]